MMTKEEFLNRVKERAEIGSVFAAERACRSVFLALKEAMQSEDIEEQIGERLSPDLRIMFENPKVEAVKVPELLHFVEDDVVEEGRQPEDVAIPVLEELKEVKI